MHFSLLWKCLKEPLWFSKCHSIVANGRPFNAPQSTPLLSVVSFVQKPHVKERKICFRQRARSHQTGGITLKLGPESDHPCHRPPKDLAAFCCAEDVATRNTCRNGAGKSQCGSMENTEVSKELMGTPEVSQPQQAGQIVNPASTGPNRYSHQTTLNPLIAPAFHFSIILSQGSNPRRFFQ